MAASCPGSIYFLSRDRLVAGTLSPYGFVAGNPVNAADTAGDEGFPLTASGQTGPTQWQYRYDPKTQLLHFTATNPAAGSFTITMSRNGSYEWTMVSNVGPVTSYDVTVGSHTNTPPPWYSFVNPFNSGHILDHVASDTGQTRLPRYLGGNIEITGVVHTEGPDGPASIAISVQLPNPEQWPDWLASDQATGCSGARYV